MKYLLAFSLFVFSIHLSAFSQEQSQNTRNDYNALYKSVLAEYGFDQVLFNVVYYQYKYWRKIGHQYLLEDQLYSGTLVYKGEVYKGVDMKYDIFDQQLIICIKNNNSVSWIVPPYDFISAFSFDGKYFSKYIFGGVTKYYQVIFDKEKLKCLYFWFKQRVDSNKLNYSGYNEFTDSEKENFLTLGGTLKKYKNNRSFTEIFPDDIKVRVKEYIRNNNIDVAKSSDEKIKELMIYCNSLL